jgi:hypothetical protein
MLLIDDTRCAKKQFAASFDNSADEELVLIILSFAT